MSDNIKQIILSLENSIKTLMEHRNEGMAFDPDEVLDAFLSIKQILQIMNENN